ncbi:hypothetical protein A0H81_12797 [Grifola frondosa]|uniref:Uncharacterized protein n=1 Tax=Grifola frondosa TaxID=5627 RepID=A0A1C7LQR1_GRIFR|nr:hypothetical protein A0H81_12797 [Grifola frondosa]
MGSESEDGGERPSRVSFTTSHSTRINTHTQRRTNSASSIQNITRSPSEYECRWLDSFTDHSGAQSIRVRPLLERRARVETRKHERLGGRAHQTGLGIRMNTYAGRDVRHDDALCCGQVDHRERGCVLQCIEQRAAALIHRRHVFDDTLPEPDSIR